MKRLREERAERKAVLMIQCAWRRRAMERRVRERRARMEEEMRIAEAEQRAKEQLVRMRASAPLADADIEACMKAYVCWVHSC